MRWPGANLEEKHEPRGVSVAEAQNGDSMKSSGRNLTLAAIEKHEPRGVSVAEAQNGDSMKSSGRNLTLAAIEKQSLVAGDSGPKADFCPDSRNIPRRSHGRPTSDHCSLRVRLQPHPLWRRRCLKTHPGLRRPLSAPHFGAIFASLELSRRTWLITSLSPGGGEKMSKCSVPAGEVSGLLRRFAELRRKAAARTGRDSRLSSSRRSVWTAFEIHRVLQTEGIESHVVDAASILTSRRRRRARTDRIDGETLVRTLMAYKR